MRITWTAVLIGLTIVSTNCLAQAGGRTDYPNPKTFWKACNEALRECGKEMTCDKMDSRSPVVFDDPDTPCKVKEWKKSPLVMYFSRTDCVCGKETTIYTISELYEGVDDTGKACAKKKEETMVFVESGKGCATRAQTPQGVARESRLCP